jgi:hypothetical protein
LVQLQHWSFCDKYEVTGYECRRVSIDDLQPEKLIAQLGLSLRVEATSGKNSRH